MKKILTSLALGLILCATSVSAEPLRLFTHGSNTSSTFRFNEGLNKAEPKNTELVTANGFCEGARGFRNAKGPAALTFASMDKAAAIVDNDEDCAPDVPAESSALIAMWVDESNLCVAADSSWTLEKMIEPGTTVRFARSWPHQALLEFSDNVNKLHGTSWLSLPYKGSANRVAAVVAGEVDAVMLQDSIALKYMSTGEIRCIGTSGTQEHIDVGLSNNSPLKTVRPIEEVIGVKFEGAWENFMIVKNTTPEDNAKIRSMVKNSQTNSSAEQHYQTYSVVNIITDNVADEYNTRLENNLKVLK